MARRNWRGSPGTPSPSPKQSSRSLLRHMFAPVRAVFSRIAIAGTAGYPPDTVRRLKILNVIAALISLTTTIYAIQLALGDYQKFEPVVWINVVLAIVTGAVPFMHRFNETAGGLLLVTAEFIALFGFTAYFGRSGGAPMQYIVAAAAPFVIFGLERLWLVIAVVVGALTLHLAAWFSFHRSTALLQVDDGMLQSLYVQGAITTFGLIAASVYYAFSLAEHAKAETDSVLRNVLPDSVVERLKADPNSAISDGFSSASILFADISGFVAMARKLGPEQTVAILNRLVSAFDALAERHGVEKIKTIGDAYMVGAGIPVPRPDHAEALAAMALDMLATARSVSAEVGQPLDLRIGMASGPMMAGVIGRHKFSYDVWGDPVNLASRLESASEPGRILICPACYDALAGKFTLQDRGKLDIKGVGLIDAWYVTGRTADVSPSSASRTTA